LADGSFTKTVLKDVVYDVRGKRTGTLTEVTQGGQMESRQFKLDGAAVSALALKAALKAESERTGLSAGRILLDWFENGRLAETSVQVILSKVSEILRTNISYNSNGQMVHYEDRTSDRSVG
jgi:hypothetical protein